MVQCWENTTMFILFYSSLFYFIWLTADYTNIVASCVALPNSICEHVDTNNMNIYDIYNELIQMKVMLCICKPFPIRFSCILAQCGNSSVQTLSPLLVGNSMVVTVSTLKWRTLSCVCCFGRVVPLPWVDGGTHTEHDGTGSLCSELAALCSSCLERLFTWLSFRFSVVYFHFTAMR